MPTDNPFIHSEDDGIYQRSILSLYQSVLMTGCRVAVLLDCGCDKYYCVKAYVTVAYIIKVTLYTNCSFGTWVPGRYSVVVVVYLLQ